MTTVQPAAVIILAAGAGTRMKSSTPKVLHEIAGRTMLGHAIHAAQGLNPERISVVVRHQRDLVAEHITSVLPSTLIVDQDEIPGTGRAVQCALSALDAVALARSVEGGLPEGSEGKPPVQGISGAIVVMAGDIPLLDREVLSELLSSHQASGSAITILTALVPDATGYGRIVRESNGSVEAIVEHREATEAQRAINEINSSIYVFDADVLRDSLGQITSNNAQSELYLTDVIKYARQQSKLISAQVVQDSIAVEGANDQVQFANLRKEFNRRIVEKWMLQGVNIFDPATTWIDATAELSPDVSVLPNTQIKGASRIESHATVGPDTTLIDTEVKSGANVTRTHANLAVIGNNATVGPFAYLRPGTILEADGKIGTFVETKNAQIGRGSKVPHLSYVGDATIGEHTNIGAGSIFVNYDGVNKHRTSVGSYSRTGANNLFVAPVNIGDAVYTAAGSTIRRDVPSGALAVSAGTQRNIEGWVEARRAGTQAALQAEAIRHNRTNQSEVKNAEGR